MSALSGNRVKSQMILSPIYPVNTRYLNPRSIKPSRIHTELISTTAKRLSSCISLTTLILLVHVDISLPYENMTKHITSPEYK